MDLGATLNLASTLAVVAGLVFTGFQLRLLHQQRERDAMMHLVQSFRSPEFVEAMWLVHRLPDGLSREEIDARLGDKAHLIWVAALSLENLGFLVSRRELSLDMVISFFNGPVLIGWRKLARYVEDTRKELGVDTPLEYFQWLAEQVIKRREAAPRLPAHIALKDWQP